MVERRHVYDVFAAMKFVKSIFFSGGLRRTLSKYDRSQNKIRISETRASVLHEQRMYETS